MTSENAIKWLQAEQFNQWVLYRGNKEEEKVSSSNTDSESVDDAVERFRNIIALQMPGPYLLKGFKGKSANAAAVNFRFEVKSESNTPITRNTSSMGGFNAQDLFDKAEESALNKFRTEQWKKDVEKNIETLFKEIENIKLSIKELHDDDDDNDDNALDRLTNAASQLPTLASGLQNLKGMFGK